MDRFEREYHCNGMVVNDSWIDANEEIPILLIAYSRLETGGVQRQATPLNMWTTLATIHEWLGGHTDWRLQPTEVWFGPEEAPAYDLVCLDPLLQKDVVRLSQLFIMIYGPGDDEED